MFGLDRLARQVETIDKKIDALARELVALGKALARQEKTMGSQIEQMNQKLDTIANNETKLGTDIQQVVDYLRSNPNPSDLTQQLTKLDQIGQALIDTDAQTLANLPPTPAPTPAPEPPPPGRRQ